MPNWHVFCQILSGFLWLWITNDWLFFKSSSRTIEHTFLNGKEGLEVASQCLQTAYCLAPEDKHLEVSKPIEQIFKDATKNEPVRQTYPDFESVYGFYIFLLNALMVHSFSVVYYISQ